VLRFISIAICVIVAVSFLIFAVDQTNSASHRQTEATLGVVSGPTPASAHQTKNPVHRAIDDAAGRLTAPFSGVVAASSSEWASRGVKLLLTLLVYGFGLGYLARALRVRV
jgi:hypothetical protein